MRGIYQNFELK